MNSDGTGQFALISTGPNEMHPNWWGDGTRIVYETESGIYRYDFAAPPDLQLTPAAKEPAWSPDGIRVVYRGASDFLYTVRADGSGGQQFTSAPTRYDYEPDWQPVATPHETPFRTPPISVGLTPAFRQCGTASKPVNSSHGPPDIPGGSNPDGSCTPAQPTGTARVGRQSVGIVNLAYVFNPQPDISAYVDVTDVTTAAGADYNPNASGADLTLVARARITDTYNGPSQNASGTVVEVDLPLRIGCVSTASTAIGSNCNAITSVNSLMPGVVQAGKRAVINIFRVRVNDSGPNNVYGDGDDALFLQQGLFAP
jgi:hypothetical protein